MHSGTEAKRKQALKRSWKVASRVFWLAWVLACALTAPAFAQPSVSDISLPPVDPRDEVIIRGDKLWQWREGSYDVLWMRGACSIVQDGRRASGQEMVLWIDRAPRQSGQPTKVIAYLEEGVEVRFGFGITDQRLEDRSWLGRFYSQMKLNIAAKDRRGAPELEPQIVSRMKIAHGNGDRFPFVQTQFTVPQDLGSGNAGPSAAPSTSPLAIPPILNQPPTQPSAPPASVTTPPSTSVPPAAAQPALTQPPIVAQPQPSVAPGAAIGQTPATGVPSATPIAPGLLQQNPVQTIPQQTIPLTQSPSPASTPVVQPGSIPGTFGVAPNAPIAGQVPSVQIPAAPVPGGIQVSPGNGSGNALSFNVGAQSVEIVPRNGIASNIQFIQRPNATPQGETVAVANEGVTVVIRDVQAQLEGGSYELGTVTISADHVVAWTPLLQNMFNSDTPVEVEGEMYLEGDIVFRQGERIIYANRMYYNVARRLGIVLAAEVVATTPQYDGLVRLKADVLQQLGQGDFIANGAAVTTSRLGTPRYWLQSQQIRFTDSETTSVDPYSGQATVVDRDMRATSRNNFVYLAGFPVLYWPVFATNLQNPGYYLTGAKVKNDSIFGTQVMLDWDVYQLLGIDRPVKGTEWELSTDYLSQRGPAAGTQFRYAIPELLGISGPVIGFFDAWGIDDEGLDTLGSDRRNLTPEEDLRGRLIWRHRHYLPGDWEASLEVGLLTDRNFLEQYIEQEWDRDKDHTTGGRLRKYLGNQLYDFSATVRVNEFYTDNNELPRLDHYLLGSSFFGDAFTWSAHTSISYSDLEVDQVPTDLTDAAKFTLLDWEREREGLRAATRHEVALPLQLGPVKAVPFVSGEIAYWGEDLNGQDVTRFLGQAGARGTLPMTRLFPNVQSSLLNVKGLAHKIELNGEFFFAEADEDLSRLPMYDQLDDNAQEQFRRRFYFNTFGLAPPAPFINRFDPRYYAVRMGLQRNVTSPSTEIAEDLMQARVGFHNRWQTKRGLPGRERIVDLALLDVDLFIYPDGDRDNFGEVAGPLTYDFKYHAGDRVTVLSDGYFDFFTQGLKTFSAGLLTSRPGVGDFYAGILSMEGPISSTVLQGAVDYRLNEKWIMSAGTTFDLGRIGNVGQQLALTRIGESALVRLGITVDDGRDNVGFQFRIEPRFWPNRKLGRLGGQLIPPPGAEGLE